MNKPKFYVASSIPYASGYPHIGNNYELILADAIARYKKLAGFDVFFMTGTDEHGQKVADNAAAKGVTPQEYVDDVAAYTKDVCARLNIGYDHFIRTTDGYHKEAVTKIFTKLYEQGDIYKGEYEGLYCVADESFYTKSQVVGEDTCPDCGRKLQQTKETAYLLRLSKYQDRLEKFIEDNPDFIIPEPFKREMLNNFIKPGLSDLCVSRSSVKWGVPVEFDPGHVMYVWVDALSNYITGLGYRPDGSSARFDKYWPCDVHVVGKDILRFHSIYWVIMLMALGLPLPKQILRHGWLLIGDSKIGKSMGNMMYSRELTDKFGCDAARYYILRIMPYTTDASFTYENFVAVYNASLANTLGNLVSRTLAMNEKYFGGVIPARGQAAAFDGELEEAALACAGKYTALMDEYRLANAIEQIEFFLYRANKYIDETEPWILAKSEENKPRLASVIYNLFESIRFAAVLLFPVMPATCEKILSLIGRAGDDFPTLGKFGGIVPGTVAGKSGPLFARLDEAEVLASVAKNKPAPSAAPVGAGVPDGPEPTTAPPPETVISTPPISYDGFMGVDLRVGLVSHCEPLPKSDKLLLLKIDLGEGRQRQILSGIAKFYAPADLIGKKVAVVANLAPATIRGTLSEGMILASGEDDVKVVFIDDGAKPGERIR